MQDRHHAIGCCLPPSEFRRLFGWGYPTIKTFKKIAPIDAVLAANGIADPEPQAHGVLYMKKPKLIV
jgi:hypothetical protein